jgi:hypothetical protein
VRPAPESGLDLGEERSRSGSFHLLRSKFTCRTPHLLRSKFTNLLRSKFARPKPNLLRSKFCLSTRARLLLAHLAEVDARAGA